MPMTKDTLLKDALPYLERLQPCQPALVWATLQTYAYPRITLGETYLRCKREDWLGWYLYAVGTSETELMLFLLSLYDMYPLLEWEKLRIAAWAEAIVQVDRKDPVSQLQFEESYRKLTLGRFSLLQQVTFRPGPTRVGSALNKLSYVLSTLGVASTDDIHQTILQRIHSSFPAGTVNFDLEQTNPRGPRLHTRAVTSLRKEHHVPSRRLSLERGLPRLRAPPASRCRSREVAEGDARVPP